MFEVNSLTDLPPVFDGLVPSIPIIIGSFVGLIILYFCVTYLVYIPIKRNLDGRQKFISDKLKSSEKLFDDAKRNLNISKDKINAANKEANDIKKNSQIIGNIERDKIINQAKEYASTISKGLKEKSDQDYLKMKEEFLKNAEEIVISASEKIIEKKIDKNSEKKILDEFIKKLENE